MASTNDNVKKWLIPEFFMTWYDEQNQNSFLTCHHAFRSDFCEK